MVRQELVELSLGCTPLEGRLGPAGAVLPAPAISQGLGLGHGGEQLGVQQFIPEPAVERFDKVVLPRSTWFDVRRGGPAVLAPALESMGDEFGPVVTCPPPLVQAQWWGARQIHT